MCERLDRLMDKPLRLTNKEWTITIITLVVAPIVLSALTVCFIYCGGGQPVNVVSVSLLCLLFFSFILVYFFVAFALLFVYLFIFVYGCCRSS